MFQILAPLNLKEPCYLVVQASGRRREEISVALVIRMEIARVAKFVKYAGARP